MSGIPMEVSIAMGILISELNNPAFANKFITFHARPTWHHLDAQDSLYDKVQSAMMAQWGSTTNLDKALALVLRACTDACMPQ